MIPQDGGHQLGAPTTMCPWIRSFLRAELAGNSSRPETRRTVRQNAGENLLLARILDQAATVTLPLSGLAVRVPPSEQRVTAPDSAFPGDAGESSSGAFADLLSLQLGQCGENRQRELTCGCPRVQVLADTHQPPALTVRIVGQIENVSGAPGEAICDPSK